jgi:ADP-ribose pyrophosphatase
MNTHIASRTVEFKTPWFELVAKRLAGEVSPYYALRMTDYVCITAITGADELVLVRQYRPAIERYTLELPGGHVEPGETPGDSARRELAEECGFQARQVELLGTLLSDTGRHENRLWCYFAADAHPLEGGFVAEPGLERVLIPRARLPQVVAAAQFDHALHLAPLMLALLKYGWHFWT